MYGRMFEEGSDMTDMGEQEKLARGLWYDPGERGLRAARRRASELAIEFNATSPSEPAASSRGTFPRALSQQACP